MSPEQIRVYYELLRLGIGSELVKLFPGTVKRFCKINDVCFVLEMSRKKFALWLVAEDESRLVAEQELLLMLKAKGNEGFLFPVRLKNNSFYGVLENGRLFYLTNWPELRPISLRNNLNIESLLRLIINFRTVMDQSDLSGLNIKMSGKSLIVRYQDMIKSIKSFAMLAGYRLHPTKFDQIFLEYSKSLTGQAESALNLIESSAYLKMYKENDSLRPIINNLSRSNLRTLPTGQAVCISLKESVLDIPLMDLALLMAKTGRANRWCRDWYGRIIKAYSESFTLTNEDIEIIRAYILFPWELYRLATRYYHNRVNWPVSVFVEKMGRIVIGEENRKKLIQSLN